MLTLHPYTLSLRDPFRISHGSRTTQPTLIVELTDPETGLSGLGEAAQTSYYGLEIEKSSHALLSIKPALDEFVAKLRFQVPPIRNDQKQADNVGAHLATLKPEKELPLFTKILNWRVKKLHDLLDEIAPDLHPFLRCALDVALHDLEARKIGKRLNLCWEQADPERRIPTCYTIGMASIEEMQRKIQAFPWPIYKIKLGTSEDVAIIRALREVTASPFRVDANTGWTAQQTLDYAPALAELGVEFIEQPLPVADREGQQIIFQKSPLPIIADESCQTLADVADCAGRFHGINVKIVKCGGLLTARKMIAQAKALNLSVMAGCMTESSVGIAAIAQLVPELDYVDIDGALLLGDDPAQGVSFGKDGVVKYPNRTGTGAVLKV